MAEGRSEPSTERAYKPEGFSSVSPYLIVNGASGTIDFLKRVFGAVELQRIQATVVRAWTSILGFSVSIMTGGASPAGLEIRR